MLLTGCGRVADNLTVIQFASWGSQSEVGIIKPILQDFETQNPDIKVDFMHIPQNYFPKIHLLFASNTAPDVIFINNLYLPVYANAGVLMPLAAQQEFYPKALEALTWQGKLYAVPRDISNLVIYYNKDIFDKNHVPYPHEGWTLEEFLQTAQKLTDRPRVFGISFEEEPLYYMPFLMNGDENLDFYADLRKKYHVAPLKSESASATMAQMFLQGRLAMHLSGRWLVPKYREEADFNWDVATFPGIVPLDASGWAISASTKHPEEAKKLVEFLSSRQSIEKFAQSGLIVPARPDVAFWNSKAFLKAIETSKPTPVTVDYNEVLDKMKQEFEPKLDRF